MGFNLVTSFFENGGEYFRFFVEGKKLVKYSDDGDCQASLEKKENGYTYALAHRSGPAVGENVIRFRPSPENIYKFNQGCEEVAKRLLIWLDSGDSRQVPLEPPAFGDLSEDWVV